MVTNYINRNDYTDSKKGEQEYEEAVKARELELAEHINDQINNRLDAMEPIYSVWFKNELFFHGLSPRETLGQDNWISKEVREDGKLVTRYELDRPIRSKLFTALNLTAISRLNNKTPKFIATTLNKRMSKIASTLANVLSYELKISDIKSILTTLAKDFLDTGRCVVRARETERGCKFEAVSPFQFLISSNWQGNIQNADWIAHRRIMTKNEIKRVYKEETAKYFDETTEEYKSGFYTSKYIDVTNRKSLTTYPSYYAQKIAEQIVELDTKRYLSDSTRGISISEDIDDDNAIEVTEYWNKIDKIYTIIIGETIIKEEIFEDKDYPFFVAEYIRESVSNQPIAINTLAITLAEQADTLYKDHYNNVKFHSNMNFAILDTKRIETPEPRQLLRLINTSAQINDSVAVGDPIKIVQSGYTNQEAINLFQLIARNLYGLYGIASTLQGSSGEPISAKEATLKATESVQNLEFMTRKMLDELYTDLGRYLLKYKLNNNKSEILYEISSNDLIEKYIYIPEAKITKKGLQIKVGNQKFMIRHEFDMKKLGEAISNDTEIEQSELNTIASITKITNETLEKEMELSEDEFLERLSKASNGKITGYFTQIDIDNNVIFNLSAVVGTLTNSQVLLDRLVQLRMLEIQSQKPVSNLDTEIAAQLELEGYSEKENTQKAQEFAPTQPAQDQMIDTNTNAGQQPKGGINAYNLATQNPDSNYLNTPTTVPGNSEVSQNDLGM